MTDKTYEQMLADYTAELRAFFAPAAITGVPGTRHSPRRAGDLARRGERLVQMSREVGEATAGYLSHSEQARREEAQVRLLAQASAQLEVARGLLAAAEAGEPGRRKAVRGDIVSGDVRQSLERLARVLEQPLAAPPVMQEVTRTRAGDPAAARTALLRQATSSIQSISRNTARVGVRAAHDLLSLDPGVLAQGVSLISQDAGALIARLGENVSQFVRRLVLSAVQLILQAYDWVLALLGKDVESRIRQQVQQWIDELKKEKAGTSTGEEGLFDKLVDHIFDVKGITHDVTGWIKAATAPGDQLQTLSTQIAGLDKAFETLATQAENFLKLLGTVSTVALLKRVPQFAVVVAAIELSLLGYILYTGYDHVDSNRLQFLDRVKGVRDLCMTLAA